MPTLALAGDTMLGRLVAEELERVPPASLVDDEVAAIARAADLFVLNLECCISERGSPWPDPAKPFFFRAPPAAVETLLHLGVDAVTLANNHALDFGHDALMDTLDHLAAAGIAWAGAGADVDEARRPVALELGGRRLSFIGVTDHPADYAATADGAGVAFADLRSDEPRWLSDLIHREAGDGWVVVGPHWGPNMTTEPLPWVRRAADQLVDAGATLVAGHSAHVFHGVRGRMLYDVGDFLDDYAVDPVLRNDLGLLFVVQFDDEGPARLEAFPLALDFCRTRLATGDDAAWVARRFEAACSALGTSVTPKEQSLAVDLRQASEQPGGGRP